MAMRPNPGELLVKIAPPTVSAVTPPAPKTNTHNELNPAKQAKAADPAAKGAQFGALVSEMAHARNAARKAARHPSETTPPPPAVETPPVTPTVIDATTGIGETVDVAV